VEQEMKIDFLMAGFIPLISLLDASAYSAEPNPSRDRYVAPSDAGPHGHAPGMQIQPLDREGARHSEYAVIFSSGDEVFSGLSEFAQKYHVTSAHFTALGAARKAAVGWFSPERKMYKVISIDEQCEVLSMLGDIALVEGKPVVHAHLVVGLADGTTRGGHVLELYAAPTLEVMVTVDPVSMQKRLDEATGLWLIDPRLSPRPENQP
jgi:predicted DNA-binding protein with PD1-like motif